MNTVTISAGGESVTMTDKELKDVATKLEGKEAARVEGEKARKPALPGFGHNSGDDMITARKLRSTIERVERLEEEKSGLADDIKDIYAEAKAFGFDVKTIRHIIKLRKMDVEKRREAEDLLEIYKSAIGME